MGACACSTSLSDLRSGSSSTHAHGSRSLHTIVVKSPSEERYAKRAQAEMERFARKLRPGYHRAIRAQSQEAVERTTDGETVPVTPVMQAELARELEETKTKPTYAAAFAGWLIVRPILGVDTGASNQEEQVLFNYTPVAQDIASYLRLTSTREARTHATTINDIVTEARNEIVYTPTGTPRGLTNREISKRLAGEMLRFDRAYANLVARSTCVWAHNDGAQARYRASGVQRNRWYATADELTCPWCNAMHDTVVSTDAAFLGAGQSFDGTTENAAGESVTVTMTGPAWNISHPPLHPNCRCVILPEVGGF